MTHRAICLLFVATLASGPVRGQDTGRIPVQGSELFRFALARKQVEPLKDPRAALDHPRESMIVIVGDTIGTENLSYGRLGMELKRYVQSGGAVLIAIDSPSPATANFGIRITGKKRTGAPGKNYKGIDGRPFIKPRHGVPGHDGASPYDLFKDVQLTGRRAVATSRPSELQVPGEIPEFVVNVLADFPVGTFRSADGRPVEPGLSHFAVSVREGNLVGRLIVLADRDVFVNGMMGFPEQQDPTGEIAFDNDNWGLANRTIDWLKGGWPQPRTGCLFIEDGRIIDQFAVPITPTPAPPMPDIPPEVLGNIILNSMNGIVSEAEERNIFNRVIEGWLGFPRLVRAFLIVVTVLFLFACFRRLARGRRKVEPATNLTPAAQAALLPRGGVLKQRTAAQLEVGNLSEGAARRVRDRFDVLGGRPGPDGRMPPVLIAAEVTDGLILRRTVEWLWALGYYDGPVTVPLGEWDQMNGLLERVMVRASRGDWSFGQEVPAAGGRPTASS